MSTRMNLAMGCSLWLLAVPIPAHSQNEAARTGASTALPANARYQIVQSPLTLRDTFRLDRVTGRVHRMVEREGTGLVWVEMTVVERQSLPASGAPRFTLFLSGISGRSSYLLDTQTGRTWAPALLAPKGRPSDESELAWAPVAERTAP